MIDFVDGTVPSPNRFLTNTEGTLTTAMNPEFQLWNTRDQAFLTLINSTLSPSVLSMVVGHISAQAVWKTLEHRFTSTSRANVLNLKIELHNLKKGTESVSSYLQKVKNIRDKLVAVGTVIDNEELLHIILKGLPREYSPFCSAIRTRNELVSFEEIMQTTGTPILNPHSMSIILNQEAEGGTIHKEVEEEAGSIITLSINTLRISINLILSLKGILNPNRNLMADIHSAKFGGNGFNFWGAQGGDTSCSLILEPQTISSHGLCISRQTSTCKAGCNGFNIQGNDKSSCSMGNGFTFKEGCSHQGTSSVPSVPTFSVPFPSTSIPHRSPIPPALNTHSMTTLSKHGIFKPKVFHTTTNDYNETEPPTYQLASKYPKWCTAMDEEYSALQRQQTWFLVPPPIGKNIVGCKWVFKLKRNSDGSISRYKARLVAKGFHQHHGIDFQETFSLVVKPPTVRLILALVVTYNWPLKQLDVRNAFLHGVLQEEAPRAWFESFTTQLLNLGFHSSTIDTSLFIYRDGSVIAFLLLYIDDIVLTGNTPSFLTQLIANLSTVFELKDMGTLSYFLGFQIQRSTKGLTVTQTKYATDLLTKHNMVHCSPYKTPCVPNERLSTTCGQPLTDVHAYRSLVDALHYLTFTIPDISFAVHQVYQFITAPTDIHFTTAKCILRYIRGSLDHVFLGPNPITWSAKKQLTVSCSSTEAKYRALASASAELCWLCTLVKDLGIFLFDPPILWCDNVSALAIALNPVFHARTKHIEVDFHFIRERVIRKDLQVKFVSTVDQLANIFTKGLSSPRFQDLQSKLLVSVDTICLRGDDEVSVNYR
uniref:Reverse transcriptase Ty1/copia-type domain-containing protein n=1 Tax=Fagus sylvatica TaxID=28930 RepID=A0A2N9HT16_FAGSY